MRGGEAEAEDTMTGGEAEADDTMTGVEGEGMKIGREGEGGRIYWNPVTSFIIHLCNSYWCNSS